MTNSRDTRPPFAAVRKVLNRHDPEGLLAMGAPADEYEPEAEDFAGLLREGQSITRAVVIDVWGRWFGDTYFVRAGTDKIDTLAADLDALR